MARASTCRPAARCTTPRRRLRRTRSRTMEVTASSIKDLRERTGAGMSDCKKALVEVSGDMDKAIDYLRAKGLAKAAKKAGREATEGAVVSYIHGGGRIGVLVEINCETDFVSRNEDFVGFTREVAQQAGLA